jgi:hypothetical protein
MRAKSGNATVSTANESPRDAASAWTMPGTSFTYVRLLPTNSLGAPVPESCGSVVPADRHAATTHAETDRARRRWRAKERCVTS